MVDSVDGNIAFAFVAVTVDYDVETVYNNYFELLNIFRLKTLDRKIVSSKQVAYVAAAVVEHSFSSHTQFFPNLNM